MPAPKKRSAPKKSATPKKKRVAPPSRQPAKNALVYQFKVTLLDVRPPIWRRILVPVGTLDDLHGAIQNAMGWTNSHLHQFDVDGRRYGDPEMLDDGFGDADFADSRKMTLSKLFGGARPPSKILYEYDFGDGWTHHIEFEGTQPAETGQKLPSCVAGKRSCPPEDIGGPWGYANFLEAIHDPQHEDHEMFVEWVGDDFDAEAFDLAEINKAMREGLPNWRD